MIETAQDVVGNAAGHFTDTQLGSALMLSLMVNVYVVWRFFKYINAQANYWRKKANDRPE